MPRDAEIIDTESRMLPGPVAKAERELVFNGERVPIGKDDKVLELEAADGGPQQGECTY